MQYTLFNGAKSFLRSKQSLSWSRRLISVFYIFILSSTQTFALDFTIEAYKAYASFTMSPYLSIPCLAYTLDRPR